MSRLTYTAYMATEQTDTPPHAPDEHYCEHTGCNEWGGCLHPQAQTLSQGMLLV